MKLTKKQIYIMQGKSPEGWCNMQPLGPYESKAKAMQAIRRDVQDSVDGAESLVEGKTREWCEKYHIVEYLACIQPVLEVKAKVILSATK